MYIHEPVKYVEGISHENFEQMAIDLFQYQYVQNDIYRQFTDTLNINPKQVQSVNEIPFLPISFFKTHKVISGKNNADCLVFKSSTTTSDIPASHYVSDENLYDINLLEGFCQFYNHPKEYAILALLPSYLQREGASLVYMVNELMRHSNHPANGFYLDEYEQLSKVLSDLEKQQQSTILIGVTFALLDFAEQHKIDLKHTIIMETGGMKGRRKELVRNEVHDFLKEQLGVNTVHSEYGMTELLSQAYSSAGGVFKPSATMKIFVRDINDPFDIKTDGSGCLNVVDLANVHSCAFIATDDVGKLYIDGSFEVMGRVDNAALRGCNLMVL